MKSGFGPRISYAVRKRAYEKAVGPLGTVKSKLDYRGLKRLRRRHRNDIEWEADNA